VIWKQEQYQGGMNPHIKDNVYDGQNDNENIIELFPWDWEYEYLKQKRY